MDIKGGCVTHFMFRQGHFLNTYIGSSIEYEDDRTHKILKRILDEKTHKRPEELLTENEINETFYYNANIYNVNEYINNPFFNYCLYFIF